MKDYTPRDLEHFTEKLWTSVGIPQRYLDGTKNADILERIVRKRKRIRNIKDIYFNGKTRD
jgi:hypothetical protein